MAVQFEKQGSEVIATFDDPLFARAETIFHHKDNRLQALIEDQIVEIGYLPDHLTVHVTSIAIMTLKAPHPAGHEVTLHADIQSIH